MKPISTNIINKNPASAGFFIAILFSCRSVGKKMQHDICPLVIPKLCPKL